MDDQCFLSDRDKRVIEILKSGQIKGMNLFRSGRFGNSGHGEHSEHEHNRYYKAAIYFPFIIGPLWMYCYLSSIHYSHLFFLSTIMVIANIVQIHFLRSYVSCFFWFLSLGLSILLAFLSYKYSYTEQNMCYVKYIQCIFVCYLLSTLML